MQPMTVIMAGTAEMTNGGTLLSLLVMPASGSGADNDVYELPFIMEEGMLDGLA